MEAEPRARSRVFLSRSPGATERLASDLGRAILGPTLFALSGDLGTGKTCFVRGLARGLDVRDPISSPTFALLQSYRGREELHHLDAWMEGRERAFLVDGGLEWLSSGGVIAIEWAERVIDVLPKPRIDVGFAHVGTDARRIAVEVQGKDERCAALFLALESITTGVDLEEIRAF